MLYSECFALLRMILGVVRAFGRPPSPPPPPLPPAPLISPVVFLRSECMRAWMGSSLHSYELLYVDYGYSYYFGSSSSSSGGVLNRKRNVLVKYIILIYHGMHYVVVVGKDV